MNFLVKLFGANWKTTIGGILVGVPPLVNGAALAASITLPKWEIFVATLAMGLGGLILGFNAKDATTHSTATQVQQATDKANGKEV